MNKSRKSVQFILKPLIYLFAICLMVLFFHFRGGMTGSGNNNCLKKRSGVLSCLKSGSQKTDPLLVWIAPGHLKKQNSSIAIYYSPHQDDETIGMGASIAEQVRSGRPVYVVLLSRGDNENMLNYLRSVDPDAEMQDVIEGRNNEFIAACKALGVQRIYIANGGNGFDERESFPDLVADFKKTMTYFANLFENSSQYSTSGNCDSYNQQCDKMPAHQAAATALHQLYDAGLISDITLFREYYYYNNSGKCDRPCSLMKSIDEIDKLQRQKAINEYKFVDLKIHRYGLGYWHSVDVLFNNSWNSNLEEIDSIRNDY